MAQTTMKMFYYAYLHSIMYYGLIFWGNPSHRANTFNIQKNLIRIITGCKSWDWCNNLFKHL